MPFQINKLNKIGLFYCDVCLSTSKFEFSATCWSAAEIPFQHVAVQNELIWRTEILSPYGG